MHILHIYILIYLLLINNTTYYATTNKSGRTKQKWQTLKIVESRWFQHKQAGSTEAELDSHIVECNTRAPMMQKHLNRPTYCGSPCCFVALEINMMTITLGFCSCFLILKIIIIIMTWSTTSLCTAALDISLNDVRVSHSFYSYGLSAYEVTAVGKSLSDIVLKWLILKFASPRGGISVVFQRWDVWVTCLRGYPKHCFFLLRLFMKFWLEYNVFSRVFLELGCVREWHTQICLI